jgi:hypothetical protein
MRAKPSRQKIRLSAFARASLATKKINNGNKSARKPTLPYRVFGLILKQVTKD